MKFGKLNLILFLGCSLFFVGCASPKESEIACNFSSGINSRDYNDDDPIAFNIIADLFLGVLNMAVQGTHRTVSPDTYDNCKPPENKKKPTNDFT